MAPTSQGRSPVATPSLMEHSLRCVHVTTYLSIDLAPYPLPHQLQPGRPSSWVTASVHSQCVAFGARPVYRKPVGLPDQHWPNLPSHTDCKPHILFPVGCTGVYSVRAAGCGWGALCGVGAPVLELLSLCYLPRRLCPCETCPIQWAALPLAFRPAVQQPQAPP